MPDYNSPIRWAILVALTLLPVSAGVIYGRFLSRKLKSNNMRIVLSFSSIIALLIAAFGQLWVSGAADYVEPRHLHRTAVFTTFFLTDIGAGAVFAVAVQIYAYICARRASGLG